MDDRTALPPLRQLWRRATRTAPGLVLCMAIGVAALGLQGLEARLLGRAWLEAVVLAILLGAALRIGWRPGPVWTKGVGFSAKIVLEVAVVLLGAAIDPRTVLAAGAPLLAGVAGLVALAIAASYGLGRLFGLPRRMSLLIACGNAVCGNSAIAAVAPVIGADGEDVTAAIAFTAILGVAVVLGLPAIAAGLHLSHTAFGVLAGLTVYAVPQVLAATVPVSALSAQVGTLVKLVRVLMLGPVVMALSLLMAKDRDASLAGPAGGGRGPATPRLGELVPWFIIGFGAMAVIRWAGLIPAHVLGPAGGAATALTVVSMAALGLGVDYGALARAGARVSAVVAISLLGLTGLALLLIRGLGLA